MKKGEESKINLLILKENMFLFYTSFNLSHYG